MKHTVTVYAPDEGVLEAQVLVGSVVGVGVGVGDRCRRGCGWAVGVGLGVRLGFENAGIGGINNARIRTALKNKNTRFEFIIFLPLLHVQAFSFNP